MSFLRKIYIALGLLCLGLIVIFARNDLSPNPNPIISKINIIAWFSSYVFVISFAGYCFYQIIHHFTKGKAIATMILIVFFACLIPVNMLQTKNLSGETTQEMHCVITHLTTQENADRTCLFGYPDRQYYLPALPTLIFGPSLGALNFGGSIYFIIGMIIFASGILRYNRYSHMGDALCGILLASFLHIYYFNFFLFHQFEQSNFPFSFCLAAVGLCIHYFVSRKKIILIPLSFIILYLLYSYTPSLAVIFLVLSFFAYLITQKSLQKKEKIVLLMLIALTIYIFTVTLSFRHDILLTDTNIRSITDLKQDVFVGIDHILLQNDGSPLTSPFYNFIFITTLLMSLSFFFGKKVGLIAWWICGTLLLSIISKGYLYYDVAFRLHRATVIFPFFLFLLMIVIKKIDLEGKTRYLYTICGIIFVTGLLFHIQQMNSYQPHTHYSFIQFLKQYKPMSKPTEEIIFIDGMDQDNLSSINDTLQYFIPDLSAASNTVSMPACKIIPEDHPLIIINIDNPCYEKLVKNPLVKNYGFFLTEKGISLALMQR